MKSTYFRGERFWSSDDVLSLKDYEQHLYFFLITNEAIPPSGIFNFSKRELNYRTNIKPNNIEKALIALAGKKMIVIYNKWMFVVHLLKESFGVGLPGRILSKTIKANIENQFKSGEVPEHLINCFYTTYQGVPIEYPGSKHIIEYLLVISDYKEKDLIPPKAPLLLEVAEKVFDNYKQVFGKTDQFEFDAVRQDKLLKALSPKSSKGWGYTEEQCNTAIRKLNMSLFHVVNGYISLENFLLKNPRRLEEWVNKPESVIEANNKKFLRENKSTGWEGNLSKGQQRTVNNIMGAMKFLGKNHEKSE